MITQKTERLILRYLNNQATFSERNKLELWLDDPINFQLFKQYLKTHYLILLNMDLFDTTDSKNQLLGVMNHEKNLIKRRKYSRIMKYAALFILFLGLGFTYKDVHFSKYPNVIKPTDQITLELENGEFEIINEEGKSQIIDVNKNIVGKQKGEQLVYDKNKAIETLVYNTLTIPFGKHFQLQLSDGTNVHLNAGSSLKYPVNFIDGNKRHVTLIGEAFFDVASDTENPFVVNAEDLNIEVLGTAFNVSAYPEDVFTDVVLVEGAIGLYADENALNETVTIKSGTKGSFNKNLKNITTEKVDVSIHTVWIDGGLVFRNMPFKNIIKKLERHYNIKININNEKLKNEVFNASFKNAPPIEKVLNAFGKSYGIRYTLKNDTIHIN